MGAIYQFDVKRGQQAAQTDFYGVGGDLALNMSIHLQWDTSLIATITLETSNFPENGQFSISTTDLSTGNPPLAGSAGSWIPLPLTATNTQIAAGAGTIAAGGISIAGGTAGGAFIDLGINAAHRIRVKVVATQAGFLRIHSAGKR